jgi:dTDP-4-dehydrorhamnose reductase
VDFCEKPENQKLVIDVNVHGTHKVAEACERYGCQMVLLSSDHVFDGKRWFGKYDEQSKASPVNYYGLTKYAAEGWANLYDNVKIVRTSYLFDKDRLQDKGWGEYPTFIKRNFMHYEHFANRLSLYLQNIKDMPKVLHLAGSVNLSWYDFMRKLAIYNYDDKYGGSQFTYPRYRETKGDCAKRPHNLNLDVSLSKSLGFDIVSYLDGFETLTLESLA